MVADACNMVKGLPLLAKSASFDRYFANFVLHVVPNADSMLSECFNLLAPGGLAGFSLWSFISIGSFLFRCFVP